MVSRNVSITLEAHAGIIGLSGLSGDDNSHLQSSLFVSDHNTL